MSQDTVAKNLVESLENRFCLHSIADEVLAVVGEKTDVKKPFVARVLAAVKEAFTSSGGTVTYPTLLGAMIATLETKDAVRQGASSPLCLRTWECGRRGVCGRSVRHCVTV